MKQAPEADEEADEDFYCEEELELHRNNFEVKTSLIPGAGLGVFAKKDLLEDEWIGSVNGPVVGSNGKHILWRYTVFGYTLIDVKGPLRYANHSSEPNIDLCEDSYGFFVFANRDIKYGEEICWNYGFENEDLINEWNNGVYETDVTELSVYSVVEWLRERNLLDHVIELARYLDDEVLRIQGEHQEK